MQQKFYTLKEVAEIIGVSYNHLVNRIVKDGLLETINIGKGERPEHRVTQQALDAFLSKESGGTKKTIKDLVKDLEKIRKSTIIAYFTTIHNPIVLDDALFFSDVIEDIKKKDSIEGKIETLDLFINSFGGSLEAAYKISRLLRLYAKNVNVIVPIYAKSAAAAICLGANEITMTPVAELGPVDPIVEDPKTKIKIPARSIKVFLSYVSNPKKLERDEISPQIIGQLRDKLEPMLVGAYLGTIETSKEHLKILLSEYMFSGKDEEEKINQLVDYFTEAHTSHAFVIDFNEANKIGLNVRLANVEEETLIKQLFGAYSAFMNANKLSKLVGNRFFMIHQPLQQQVLQEKGAD